MNIKSLIICCGLSFASQSYALDLLQAYQQALGYDAQWQSDQSRYLVEQQNLGIAKGAVLPTVSINAGIYKQYQDLDEKNNLIDLGNGQQMSFNQEELTTRQLGVTLRQPLFRMPVWEKYKQVKISLEAAELNLQLQKQSLMLQVAEQYFDVLRQKNVLALNLKEEQVLFKQYQMMQAKLKQGFVAKIEVKEAEAQYQSASAKRVAGEVKYQLALEQFEQKVGKFEGNLLTLSPSFNFEAPYPNNVEQWIERAEQNNLELNRARVSHRVAQQQIKIEQAEYYPQLEAVASSSWNKQRPQNIISSDGRADKIGLELNWTPYTGTRSALTQKSRLEAQVSQQEIDTVLRKVRTDVKRAYLQVATGQSQLDAYKIAMESAQLVSEASQASYQEGLKDMVDVLLAQRNAFAAEQEYIHAKYDYLINALKLRTSSGQLDEQDLKELNAWLE